MNEEDVVLLQIVCPNDRLSLYNKLLLLYSKYGEEALKDCKATCNKVNKNIVTCWNMFNAACAAYKLEQFKKAELIFNYVDAQVNLIYTDTEIYPVGSIEIENWEEEIQNFSTGEQEQNINDDDE